MEKKMIDSLVMLCPSCVGGREEELSIHTILTGVAIFCIKCGEVYPVEKCIGTQCPPGICIDCPAFLCEGNPLHHSYKKAGKSGLLEFFNENVEEVRALYRIKKGKIEGEENV